MPFRSVQDISVKQILNNAVRSLFTVDRFFAIKNPPLHPSRRLNPFPFRVPATRPLNTITTTLKLKELKQGESTHEPIYCGWYTFPDDAQDQEMEGVYIPLFPPALFRIHHLTHFSTHEAKAHSIEGTQCGLLSQSFINIYTPASFKIG